MQSTISCKQFLAFIVFWGIAGIAPAGFAQRLLVTTTAMSANHEPTRLSLHSLDPATGMMLAGPIVQQGAVPIMPIQYLKNLHAVAVLSRENSATNTQWRQSYIAFYDVATFRRLYQERFPMTWRSLIACGDQEGRILTAIRPASRDTETEFEVFGRAAGSPLRIERQAAVPPPNALSGEPIIMQAMSPGVTAVICRGTQEDQYALHWLNGGSATDITLPAGATHVVPSGLISSTDSRFLFVLVSGYTVNRPSGDRATWVYAFDRQHTLTTAGTPVEIPGEVRFAAESLVPIGQDTCWVASYIQETQCAYATRIRVTPTGLLKESQIPLTNTSAPILLASASTDRVGVAIGNILEVWDGMTRRGPSCTFKTPLTVVCWLSPDSLVVGEAGRVHIVDATTGIVSRTVQFQTGWVSSLVVIPASESPEVSTSAALDSTPSKRGLSLPVSVTFRGETVGQDVKALVLKTPHAEQAAWRVKYDPQTLPWLVIHPLAGTMPGVMYLGVDPQRYATGAYVEGVLKMEMEDTGIFNNPVELIVRVLPEMRPDVRRILWLMDPGKTNDAAMMSLTQSLAAPPNLFAHQYQREPVKEPLQQYRIVVVDAAAIERGVLTRKQALDYVAGGGALLLVGSTEVSTDSTVRRWLEPIGITILPNENKASEPALAYRDHMLCRHWNKQMKPKGCLIESSRAESVLVALGAPERYDSRRGILLACAYGLGRVAVMADPEPLTERAFTNDLFHWLANPIGEGVQQDLDSDRLVDSVEDANGNSTVDPGETDYLNADTDEDGIPDGREDSNLNGRVDEGETSPLLADSDGDGVADGAQDPK